MNGYCSSGNTIGHTTEGQLPSAAGKHGDAAVQFHQFRVKSVAFRLLKGVLNPCTLLFEAVFPACTLLVHVLVAWWRCVVRFEACYIDTSGC